MGEDNILVCVGVDVLILCDFEGYEMGGNHITDNFELGDAMCQHFSDLIIFHVRLRKVSWYLDSS